MEFFKFKDVIFILSNGSCPFPYSVYSRILSYYGTPRYDNRDSQLYCIFRFKYVIVASEAHKRVGDMWIFQFMLKYLCC